MENFFVQENFHFSLYERLQLDMGEKFQFLSENPGHGPSTIAILHKVSFFKNPCRK